MKRDILFLVRGLPQQYCFSGHNVFTAPVDKPFITELKEKVSSLIPSLTPFLGTNPVGLIVVGFRNDTDREAESVRDAWERLSGVLDATSLLTEEYQADVSSTTLIRDQDSPNARIKEYMPTGWMRWGPNQREILEPWSQRSAPLADYVLAFLNSVTFLDPTQSTDLVRQLEYSAKMFRQGINSGSTGIEYLCKFSALEGLVCGPDANKGRTLKGRLGWLLRESRPHIENEVSRLWKQRCIASHQAAAHDPRLLSDLPLLDLLFRACFVFALDHIDTAKCVPDLWNHHSSDYHIPEFAVQERPAGLVRLGFRDALFDIKMQFTNIGQLIDQCFNESTKRVAQKSITAGPSA